VEASPVDLPIGEETPGEAGGEGEPAAEGEFENLFGQEEGQEGKTEEGEGEGDYENPLGGDDS
jgi:hypothetical protein